MELVHIIDGQPKADSLTVAEVFGRQHKDVLRAVEQLDCSEDFRGRNFALSTYRPENGKRYYPLIQMTRDGFTFLVMGFTGKAAAEWKEKYIAAFNMMEQRLRGQAPDLNNPAQLRVLLLDYSEKVLALEADLSEAAPKVAAYERIALADKSLCITDAAKTLQMRPKDLFAWLQRPKWIYRRAGVAHWIGYQDKIQQGLLEHKVTEITRSDGRSDIHEQVRVTPKGLAKIAERAEIAA